MSSSFLCFNVLSYLSQMVCAVLGLYIVSFVDAGVRMYEGMVLSIGTN
jgi:hypothetical protein